MTTMESLLLAWLDGDVTAGYALSDLLEEQGHTSQAKQMRKVYMAVMNLQMEHLQKYIDQMNSLDDSRHRTMRRNAPPPISPATLSLWDI